MLHSALQPRVSRAWFPLSLVLLCLAKASAQTSAFSGSYQASAAVIRADVTEWGGDCGVKPQSYTLNERPTVSISQTGAHLVFGFPERRIRTDSCWSPNPNVKVSSVTASDERWRAQCRTPRGEAKQEIGEYTVTATGPYALELVEESKYDWQLKGSHCMASVRITQRLERMPEERPVDPKKPDSNGKDTTSKPAQPEPSCIAGTATRLRIRPSEARIEPGQRVCFTVQGIDLSGCAADLEGKNLRWDLKKPGAARAQIVDGCFRAAASAADAEGNFRVSAIHNELRAEAAITVMAADLSDITARRGTGAPNGVANATTGAARDINETGVQGAAVKRPDGQALWVGLGFLATVLLGLAASLVRRTRQQPAPGALRRGARPITAPPVEPAPAMEQAAIAQPPAQGAAAQRSSFTSVATLSTEPMICPNCRRGYPPGASRCEGDGTPLIPYAEFSRRAKAEGATSYVTCPHCGARVAAADAFCGSCGRKMKD